MSPESIPGSFFSPVTAEVLRRGMRRTSATPRERAAVPRRRRPQALASARSKIASSVR